MEARATLQFLKMSPRKVKLVIDVVRGLSIARAEEQLLNMPKKAAEPILKLIKSAEANAVNNFKLVKENLFIKKIAVNQGPVISRYKPRAFGRAFPIRKPTCHVEVIVAEKSAVAAVNKPKVNKK